MLGRRKIKPDDVVVYIPERFTADPAHSEVMAIIRAYMGNNWITDKFRAARIVTNTPSMLGITDPMAKIDPAQPRKKLNTVDAAELERKLNNAFCGHPAENLDAEARARFFKVERNPHLAKATQS